MICIVRGCAGFFSKTFFGCFVFCSFINSCCRSLSLYSDSELSDSEQTTDISLRCASSRAAISAASQWLDADTLALSLLRFGAVRFRAVTSALIKPHHLQQLAVRFGLALIAPWIESNSCTQLIQWRLAFRDVLVDVALDRRLALHQLQRTSHPPTLSATQKQLEERARLAEHKDRLGTQHRHVEDVSGMRAATPAARARSRTKRCCCDASNVPCCAGSMHSTMTIFCLSVPNPSWRSAGCRLGGTGFWVFAPSRLLQSY